MGHYHTGKDEERRGMVIYLCSALSFVQHMQLIEAQTHALWYLN